MQSFRGAQPSGTPTPPIRTPKAQPSGTPTPPLRTPPIPPLRTPKAGTAVVRWKDVDRKFFTCKRCNRMWITQHAANICECQFSPREPLSASQRGLFATAQEWVQAQQGFTTTTTTTTTTRVTTSVRNDTK